MLHTLLYRGVAIGHVDLQPAVVPGDSAERLRAVGEMRVGSLVPTGAYAAVRRELGAMTHEASAMPDATPEAIRERLVWWQREYAANGLELRTADGERVPAAFLTVLDALPDEPLDPELDLVFVSALFPHAGA